MEIDELGSDEEQTKETKEKDKRSSSNSAKPSEPPVCLSTLEAVSGSSFKNSN